MRKANTNTLAHLLGAMAAGRAVTIRYTRKDGEVSRRRIEIHSFQVTSAGNITLRAWDQRDQEMTTFRVDRITHYTLHRTPKLAGYTFPTYRAEEATEVVNEYDELIEIRTWGYFELAA